MLEWTSLLFTAVAVSAIVTVYNTVQITNVTNRVDVPLGGTVVGTNVGDPTGAGSFYGKTANSLEFRRIAPADGSIEVVEDGDTIRIRAIDEGDVTSASNAGTLGVGVLVGKFDEELRFKNVAPADGTIIITEDGDNNILIRADPSMIESTVAENVGSLGAGVLYQQINQDLQFKNIAAGDVTMNVQDDAFQNILITSNITGQSVGTQGTSVYSGQSGANLKFKSVAAADTTVTVTGSGDDILVANNLQFSNAGNAGVGALLSQSGNQIRFRNVASGHASLSVQNDVPNNNVVVTPQIGSTTNTLAAGNDNRFRDAHVIKVKSTNPGAGEFSSIASALASITDASINKPYVVDVGPGIFTEPLLHVQSWIHVKGCTIMATVILPDANNHHIIQLESNTEISYLNLQNAGPGCAGVASIDAGDFTQMHKITMQDCDIGILGTSVTQECVIYIEYVDMNGVYTQAMSFAAYNNFPLHVNCENTYSIPDANGSQPHVKLTGQGTHMRMLSSAVIGFGDSCTAFSLDDHAELLLLGAYAQDCDIGLVMQNGAIARSSGISFDSLNSDVQINNVGDPCQIYLQSMVTSFRADTAVHILQGSSMGSIDIDPKAVVHVHPEADVSVANQTYHTLSVGARNAQFSSIAVALATINPRSIVSITNGLTGITAPNNDFKVELHGAYLIGAGIPPLTKFIYISPSLGAMTAAATVSITGNVVFQRSSENSAWVVQVQPGTYYEPDMFVPRGVTVFGVGGKAVVIRMQPSNSILFTMSSYSNLENLVLMGSPGHGGTTAYANDVTSVEFRSLVFYCGDYLVRITAGSSPNVIGFTACTILGIIIRGIELDGSVLSGATQQTQVTLRAVYVNTQTPADEPSTSTEPMFYAHGPHALLTSVGCTLLGRQEHEALRVDDSASVRIIGSSVEAFNIGIRSVAFGGPPSIVVNSTVFSGNVSYDLLVEHTGTIGVFNATAEEAKVTVDPASLISISFYDPDGDGTIMTGDFHLGKNISSVTNVRPMIAEAGSLGVLGDGPYVDSVSGLDIRVLAGTGYVVDPVIQSIKYLTWNNTIVTATANNINYVYIDSTGAPSISLTIPDRQQDILLARLICGASIDILDVQPVQAHHPNVLVDSFHRSHGAVFSTGCLCSVNASLQVQVGSGNYFYSTNNFSPDGMAYGTNFSAYYHSGGVWTHSTINALPTTQYDNGTNLVSASGGYYMKHSLYMIGDDYNGNEQYMLVYAQSEWANVNDALTASLPTPPPYFVQGVALIASFTVQQGNTTCTVLSERTLFSQAASSSVGGAGVIVHGDLLGLDADDHKQYMLANGGRTMTGALNMGTNSITNAGTINGVTITSIASRLLPLGADPLSTSTASSLDTSSTNTTGGANSLARSDHTHTISTYSSATLNTTPSLVQILPDTVDGPTLAGNSLSFARGNHSHWIGTAAASGLNSVSTNTQGSATSLAKSDHTHAIATYSAATLTTTPTLALIQPDVVAGATLAGNSNEFARANHSHYVQTAAPVTPLTASSTNSQGTAVTFSRSDHSHQVTIGTPVDLTPAAGNQAGTLAPLARADHVHNIPVGGAVDLDATTVSSAGSQPTFARSDHLHAIATGLPSTQAPDQSNAIGTSANLARADHIHTISTAAPLNNLDASTTNAQGSAASFARSDHSHAISTGVVNSITPDQVAAAGTSANLARADHVHNIATAAPLVSLDSTTLNAQGAASTFARSDHSHAILFGAPSSQTPNQANAAGTSARFALADHVHNIPVAAPTTNLDATTTNAAGAAATFARSDHSHAISSAAPITQTPNQTNAIGSLASFARSDHIHNIPTAAPSASLSATTANAAGSALTFSASDHSHAILTAAPVTQNTNAVNTIGTSASLARADHIHNIPTAAPITTLSASTTNAAGSATTFAASDHTHAISVGAPSVNLSATTSNAQGSSTSFALADHSHAISTGVVIAQTPDQVNAAGTSANLARADHVHNIATAAPTQLNGSQSTSQGTSTAFSRADHIHGILIGVPVTIGTANSGGSASSLALSDHVHDHGSQPGGSLHSTVTTSVNGFMIAADKAKLDTLFNWGWTAVVDKTYGANSSQAIGTAPYLTIAAALTAANAVATSTNPVTVYVRPGTYTENGPFTVGSYVTLRGINKGSVIISGTATIATDYFTVNANGDIENCTIQISTASAVNVRAVVISDTSTTTLANCLITVTSTAVAPATECIGVLSSGSSNPSEFFYTMKDCQVQVSSQTTGAACAIRLTTANTMNIDCCYLYSTRTAGAGTGFFAVQTTNASSVLRDNGSIMSGTTADIAQTAGVINLSGTSRLVTPSTNNLSFSIHSGSHLWSFSSPVGTNIASNAVVYIGSDVVGTNGAVSPYYLVGMGTGRNMIFNGFSVRCAQFQTANTTTVSAVVIKNPATALQIVSNTITLTAGATTTTPVFGSNFGIAAGISNVFGPTDTIGVRLNPLNGTVQAVLVSVSFLIM